jgi:hypothetical protein
MRDKAIFVVCVVCAIALLVGCGPSGGNTITGSGNVVSREEQVTGFEKLDIGWAFHVEVTQSEAFKVTIRVDDNLLEHVDVSKRGDTLKIGLKDDTRFTVKDGTLEATVTMPTLTSLEVSGAGRANLTGFDSDASFGAKLSGASRLTGDLSCGNAAFDLSGASYARLIGSAKNIRIDCAGASNADLDELEGVDVAVVASGGSTVTVFSSGKLDADASGTSDVFYKGGPTLGTIEASGGSSVDPR